MDLATYQTSVRQTTAFDVRHRSRRDAMGREEAGKISLKFLIEALSIFRPYHN